MPRGVKGKREEEYQQLKQKFERGGRYKGREEEVAARIVNKQRARFGETKQAKQEEQSGQSPDRNLPIKDYRHLTISELRPQIQQLSSSKLKKIEDYERNHKDRKGVINLIERALKAA